MPFEGLKGYEFDQYFKKIDTVYQLFDTVCSIDKIPFNLHVKHFVICNLSPSNQPGSHWIVIIRSEENILEIFNSLGCSTLDDLKPYLRNFSDKMVLEFNSDQFQPNTSKNCGYFCIFFIIHRVLNYDLSFATILEDYFSPNIAKNDQIVLNYCNNLLSEQVFLIHK
jgi:hypothetical protein